MRNDKHLAIKLRRKGKSYNKISKELDIPKSTLSDWFSNFRWSQKIKKELERKANYIARKRLRLICKARREYWEKWREEFRKEACKEFPLLLKDPLFITGINLYWAEGDSKLKNGRVELVNTDPRMIALFVKFLRKIVRVPDDKIFAWLTIYPDLSENRCRSFWSRNIGLAPKSFHKTQVIYGRHPTKKVEYGMCSVQVNSRGLKEKIFTWIDLFCHKLL
ncbi:MAG: hypothetical protein AUJ24_00230 [Parcubacteria group bacterium CG1_02_36_42]|nr:MAG: hypothetical protein AUJ24_00230 [Parcubacteria group bacterium CG1_02_36_42]